MTFSPRVFISSTIYDFRDIRSSLKYYLEQAGFEVLSSEFNDFKKDIDTSPYSACLKSIETCDYFILFIGSRVGGLFDIINKISITQMEYRTAYGLAKTGKIKIITFVRNEIWVIKEDRKALEQYLISSQILETEKIIDEAKSIAHFSSKFVNDAEFIFNFISEVSRNDEMKEAMLGKSPFPIANWVHSFNTFSDVIESINNACNINSRLSYRIACENLKRELISNLTSLTEKYNDKVKITSHWTIPFRSTCLPLPTKLTTIKAKNKHIKWIILGGISMGRALHGLRTSEIEHCINNGHFYDYSLQSDIYVPQRTHELLEILRDRIYKLRLSLDSATTPKLMQKYQPIFHRDEETSSIDIIEFLFLISAAAAVEDVANISKAILRHLSNIPSAYDNLSLNPMTPFGDDEEKQLSKEQASAQEILSWALQHE